MTGSGFGAMGGYGLYVWGAYGVTAIAIGGELWLLRRRWRAGRHDTGGSTGETR